MRTGDSLSKTNGRRPPALIRNKDGICTIKNPAAKARTMARCDHCGTECILPFTCQHCGGKFCPECRLPPNHDCSGIGSWNAKPRPAVGMNYSRGGGVSATGGIAPESRRSAEKNAAGGLPYLKILFGIVLLVLLGLAWLAFSGYRM